MDRTEPFATSHSASDRRPRRGRRRILFTVGTVAVLLPLGVRALTHDVAPRLLTHYDRAPALARVPKRTEADGRPGDPVNVALVGNATEVAAALRAAGWVPADPVTRASSLGIAESVILRHPYPTAPVSPLVLFGRAQDVAFEREVGGSARVRHHVRLWAVAGAAVDGRPVWVGDAAFDRSAGVSHRALRPTHHITPDVDLERDTLVADLARAGQVGARWHVTGVGVRVDAHNAEGDRYDTDGEMTVVELPPGNVRIAPSPPLAPDPPAVAVKNRIWAWAHALYAPRP